MTDGRTIFLNRAIGTIAGHIRKKSRGVRHGNFSEDFGQGQTINNYPITHSVETESQTEIVKDAINEVVKEEESKNKQKFNALVRKSHKVLFQTKNVFPFDLFPDEIIVDENKVNIVIGEFFFTNRVHAVSISDITDVFVEAGPFFATLKIVDVGFVEKTIDIRYLWKKDADKIRRLIQGLVVAEKEKIDVQSLTDPKLVQKLEELGTSYQPPRN